MITVWQAIVLAVVQGITEFFPVSSTAHLVLIPWAFHWQDPGLTFDVALHAGTLVAVIAFFFMTWIRIFQAAAGVPVDVHTGGPLAPAAARQQQSLLWLLVLATIPGGIIGWLFDKRIETTWRNPLIIAASLIIVALIMAWADAAPRQVKDFDQVSPLEALWIGLAQATALVPGVSRSGSTITAGLFCGLTREAAARFSFLMATPIIAGAVLKKGLELRHTGFPPGMETQFIVGTAVSAVVGLGSIALFVRYLRLRTLRPFVYYRIALGVLVLLLVRFGGFTQF